MLSDPENWAKAHYLDASVLVKILVVVPEEEPGREALRRYMEGEANFFTTSFCFAETLGVIKVRYWAQGKITDKEYLRACEKLLYDIQIDEVPITNYKSFEEAKRIVEEHKIDIADAMQIVTLKSGKFSVLGLKSKSILITADESLAKAARAEEVRVWNCRTEPKPV